MPAALAGISLRESRDITQEPSEFGPVLVARAELGVEF